MGKKNDIFISYPRESDTPIFSDHADIDRWVKCFYDSLAKDLPEDLGKKPNIWIDFADLEHTGDFEKHIKTAIEESSLFIVIFSKLFLHKEWCRKEFDHFRAVNGTGYKDKLIVIAKKSFSADDVKIPGQPVQENIQSIYKEIKSVNYIPFFTTTNGVDLDIDPIHDGGAYKKKIGQVSATCCEAIMSQTSTFMASPIHKPEPEIKESEPLDDGKIRVIFAQQIEGRPLSLSRQKLERSIDNRFNQDEIKVEIVEPERTQADDSRPINVSVPHCQHCHLYVQIIDQYGYMCDEGEDQSPENLQYEAVQNCAHIEKIIWRVKPQPESFNGDDYIAFNEHDESVLECSFSEFEAEVLNRIETKFAILEESDPKVFLDYHLKDKFGDRAVEKLRNHILSKNVGVHMYVKEKENWDDINPCNGAIVVYGDPEYQDDISNKAIQLGRRIKKGRVYVTSPEKTSNNKYLIEQPGGYLDIRAETDPKLDEVDKFLKYITKSEA